MGLNHRWSYESVVEDLKRTETAEFKAPVSGQIHVALVFPGPYSLGMSNLGFLTVHRLLASIPGIGVERFFHPILEGRKHPPPYYSFETKRPLSDFDILAFSLSYEGAFDRLPSILGPLGIPIVAEKRKKGRYPILMAGGAAVGSNPSALLHIFDILVPGEAEPVLKGLFEAFLARELRWEELGNLPGVLVPRHETKVKTFPPPHDVSQDPAYSHIVTTRNVFGGCALIEVMRGCPRKCAFCLARHLYHPPRALAPERFRAWLDHRPEIREIGLIASSLFDYPYLPELMTMLRERGIKVRNSSVKWERLTPEILDILAECGTKGLTLAPETGSTRLQKAMGKTLIAKDFYDTIRMVQAHGFEHLKLYFMVGLPQETLEDLDASVDLIEKTLEVANRGFKTVLVSFSGFVPKWGTPWELESALDLNQLKQRFNYLKTRLQSVTRGKALKTAFESPHEVVRQAYLAKVGPELAIELENEAKEWQKRGTFSEKPEQNLDF